jgi:hypothetical protein
VVTLLKFWVFSSFSFCQKYIFNLGAILSNFPSSKYNLFLTSAYQYIEKFLLLLSISFVNSLLLVIFMLP